MRPDEIAGAAVTAALVPFALPVIVASAPIVMAAGAGVVWLSVMMSVAGAMVPK